jgi:hypothetical protein
VPERYGYDTPADVRRSFTLEAEKIGLRADHLIRAMPVGRSTARGAFAPLPSAVCDDWHAVACTRAVAARATAPSALYDPQRPQLKEQLDYNLLYRGLAGLTLNDAVEVPAVLTKNRDRLLDGGIAKAFVNQVLALVNVHHLLSRDSSSITLFQQPARS